VRRAVALLTLATLVPAGGTVEARPGGSTPAGVSRRNAAKTRRPILLVMRQLVDELSPAATPGGANAPRRFTVMNGLAGLGAYQPTGGAGFGQKAPPLDLYPRAGLGTSLNVDPVTGRLY